MVWPPRGKKKFDDTITRFDRIDERDRQTDRHRMTALQKLGQRMYVCMLMNHTQKSYSRRLHTTPLSTFGWFRGSAVERWSLTGKLSLSCARPVQLTGDHLCG